MGLTSHGRKYVTIGEIQDKKEITTMMIQIALHAADNDMPNTTVIEEVMKQEGYSDISKRRQVAARLEATAISSAKVLLGSYLSNNSDAVVLMNKTVDNVRNQIINGNLPSATYYVYDKYADEIQKIVVQTVDTNRMWTIQETDGFETIKYYEPKFLEQDYNYVARM